MASTDSAHPRVGFVGLGIMGSLMAANLARAGFALTVTTRTAGKAEAWAQEHGATAVATPAEAAAASDILITMVVDGPQVREILLGEHGVASGAAEGLLCVDMSTIAPADARSIGEDLAAQGIGFVDAPVTGSSPKAADGTLTIMAGGSDEDVGRAWPLLQAMGELILHVGPLGHGQTIKLINNAVAASNANTLAQALVVGSATGVDLKALTRIMAAGSGGSAMVALKAAPMLEHDYTTLFKLEHMLKDVRLCIEEGQAAGVPFPAAAATREVLTAAMGRGHADDDFIALLEAVEGLAGRRM
jgi:3-hydroxyisobutyrate dehydrogenase-like beta-hydroxyacid dehydrogenase